MNKVRLFCYCLPSLLALVAYSAYGNLLAPEVNIHETAHIHANGSGRFEMAADLAKVGQFIKLACLLADVTPEDRKKGIQEACSTAAHSLEHIPGISHVTATYDDKMLYFELGFQFDKIQTLNEAVRVLYILIDHPGATYFKMDRHAFSRIDTINTTQLLAHYRKRADQQREDASTQTEGLIMRNILNVVTYNITYSFDRKIKEVTNALADVSEDGKKIMMTQSLSDACAKQFFGSNKVIF